MFISVFSLSLHKQELIKMETAQTQKKQLPDEIILRQRERDADSGIRKAVQKMQLAYTSLSKIDEITPVSTSIEDITEGWVRSIIDKRIEIIDADLSLTFSEKATRKQLWRFVLARSMKHINIIITILQEWPDARWTFDEDINNFYCSNIDEVIKRRATYVVSSECKEHYSLIWQAIEQVRNLRQWEEDHKIKTQSLAFLQELPVNQFLEVWANGSVKFDMGFTHLGISPKNFHDPQNKDRVII